MFYLLSLSWASVFSSLPSYNRFKRGDATLKYFAVVQSYILFAFALAIIIKAPTFGATPLCNSNAQAVIFRPFSALRGGRITAAVVLSIVIATYTWLTYSDYAPQVKRKWQERKKAFREKYKAWRTSKRGADDTSRKFSWPRTGPLFANSFFKNRSQEESRGQTTQVPRDIQTNLGAAEQGQVMTVATVNYNHGNHRPPPESPERKDEGDEKPKPSEKKKRKGRTSGINGNPNVPVVSLENQQLSYNTY